MFLEGMAMGSRWGDGSSTTQDIRLQRERSGRVVKELAGRTDLISRGDSRGAVSTKLTMVG